MTSAPNISVDADSLVDNPSRGRADHSTDPLQRRAELIDHYDRHGYPTRARYLERQPDGQALLRRGSELNSLDSEHRGEMALAWARDMLAYWTGWSADSWDQLAPVFSVLADFTAHARRVEADQRASLDARERSRARVQVAREACRPIADTLMALGLWARVNSYLEPIGVATADSLCYQQLKALRRVCGEQLSRVVDEKVKH